MRACIAFALLCCAVVSGCAEDRPQLADQGIAPDSTVSDARPAAVDRRVDTTAPFKLELCSPTKDCPLGKFCMAVEGGAKERGFCIDECRTQELGTMCAVLDSSKNLSACVEVTFGQGLSEKLCLWFCEVEGKKYDCPDKDFICMAADEADPSGDKLCILADPVPGTWVTIPAGTFTMGSPTSELCREPTTPNPSGKETQHQVTLSHAFEIATTEVTQSDFKQLVGVNPSQNTACGGTCPVENVTWSQAVDYCNRLSAIRSLSRCYTCSASGKPVCSEVPAYAGSKVHTCPGYRLPTDAEWEYAYRAGTTEALYDGPLGVCEAADANADQIAFYAANSGNVSHPVGGKKANAWGLHDMPGNVVEWCHDVYEPDLGGAAVTDPGGPVSGTTRVLRGGSYTSFPKRVRAAYRDFAGPEAFRYDFGFRCVRTIF